MCFRRFFDRLTSEEQAALVSAGRPRVFHGGQHLMRHGDSALQLALIQAGRAKVIGSTNDGHRTILAVREAGDLVGESDYYTGGTYLASVVVASATQALMIDRQAFTNLLREYPRIAEEIARSLNEQLVWANRRRTTINLPVMVRTAEVLLDLHRSGIGHSQGSRPPATADIPFTQRELAELIGAAEVSVQKALRQLADAGLVVRRYGRTSIVLPDKMERFLEEMTGTYTTR